MAECQEGTRNVSPTPTSLKHRATNFDTLVCQRVPHNSIHQIVNSALSPPMRLLGLVRVSQQIISEAEHENNRQAQERIRPTMNAEELVRFHRSIAPLESRSMRRFARVQSPAADSSSRLSMSGTDRVVPPTVFNSPIAGDPPTIFSNV